MQIWAQAVGAGGRPVRLRQGQRATSRPPLPRCLRSIHLQPHRARPCIPYPDDTADPSIGDAPPDLPDPGRSSRRLDLARAVHDRQVPAPALADSDRTDAQPRRPCSRRDGVIKLYGGLRAVDGLSFSVARGRGARHRRPERRRQDDAVRHRHRPWIAQRPARSSSARPADPGTNDPPPLPARAGPHVPAAFGLRHPDRRSRTPSLVPVRQPAVVVDRARAAGRRRRRPWRSWSWSASQDRAATLAGPLPVYDKKRLMIASALATEAAACCSSTSRSAA